eukprot:c35487_g1_i1 orf=3-263(-)
MFVTVKALVEVPPSPSSMGFTMPQRFFLIKCPFTFVCQVWKPTPLNLSGNFEEVAITPKDAMWRAVLPLRDRSQGSVYTLYKTKKRK